MATPQMPQEPQRFVERRPAPPTEEPLELEVWRARQKFALILGGVLVAVLVVGGAVALLFLREWRTSAVQAPPLLPTTGDIARVPSAPEPAGNPMVTTPAPLAPPPTTTVNPPLSSPQPQPSPSPERPQHPPPPPKVVLDYLEQLRQIELRRKTDAKNLWPAIVALGEMVQAVQGLATTGDPLEPPSSYDPQKTLQTFVTYQTAFARLHQWLQRLQPPPECLSLHTAYDQALQAHVAVIGKLRERIALKDLAGTAMIGLTAQRQINSALQTADSELARVCARYNIPKFFTIGDE
ncbi:hypothetical protein HRbin17_01277 [bacterium HR17]|jgi:hypothetical protein|uniref:Uncharacterized protein n=1 Tax=Candidatus Fervidibacter japonicus TaxID=2035412 RepID=A0A2H5XC61_9BACT|nr:hypothetical protein HRbin17_01277 [bacterium HR17]